MFEAPRVKAPAFITATACGISVAFALNYLYNEAFLRTTEIVARCILFAFWNILLFASFFCLLRFLLIEPLGVAKEDIRIERLHLFFLPTLILWGYPLLENQALIYPTFNAFSFVLILRTPILMVALAVIFSFRRELFFSPNISFSRLRNPRWIYLFLAPVVIVILEMGIDRAFMTGLSIHRKASNRNILLISIDTLRPDFLGCYGATYEASPAIDQLAGRSLLYERTYSTSPWTAPAHMSMLTGLLPSEHGVNPTKETNVLRPSADVPTLAEILRGDHYHTVGFTGKGLLGTDYGFDRGFDIYESMLFGDSIDEATNFIETNDPRRKFFLFVHTYEVHDFFRELGGVDLYLSPVTEQSLADMKRAYIKRITKVDQRLADLFSALRSKGYQENTLIILTSDHGEGFNEHNLIWHGNSLYDELLRVPLIISDPESSTNRGKIASLVSLLDLMPSILDWADSNIPANLRGRRIIAGGRRPTISDRRTTAFAENALLRAGGAMYSITTGRYKYIHYASQDKELLFDIGSDPEEKINLTEREPKVLKKQRTKALELLKNLNRHSAEAGELTEELETQLRALGYIQ